MRKITDSERVISEINRKARSKGMSYDKYVAMTEYPVKVTDKIVHRRTKQLDDLKEQKKKKAAPKDSINNT